MKIIHKKTSTHKVRLFSPHAHCSKLPQKFFTYNQNNDLACKTISHGELRKKAIRKPRTHSEKKNQIIFHTEEKKSDASKKTLFHFCALVSFVLILTFVDSHTLAISTFVPHVCILHPNKLTQNFLFVLFWFFCFRHWAFVCEVSLI